MKLKIFLAVSLVVALLGKAYLWSNDSSYTQFYNESMHSMKNYAQEKKNAAIEGASTYVEETKKAAVEGVKGAVRGGFDATYTAVTGKEVVRAAKSDNPISDDKATSSTEEKTTSKPTEDKPLEIPVAKPTEDKELVALPKPNWLYEVKFKYDKAGAPEDVSEKDFLNFVKEASKIWEESCGVKFTYDGMIRSDYISIKRNTESVGIIRWSDLDNGILGVATQGSTRAPVYNFVLELNHNQFQTMKDGQKVLDANELYNTIIHELGHVVGLDHSRLKESVMYHTSIETPSRLNAGDTEMCQNIASQWEKNPVNKKYRVF